ncbi:aminoglycoside phosphotransferase family protein [Actinocatenispora rupis]|uniref:Streptomycin 6-kinase n=1 Tax=Actinocatenispora rupis TaxID=519421 RepID=A0A8J3JCX0_9ACTN|nr:aminoglycoside phosphotransferase family protein [Actinocatenispora rupis]GID16021.1 streptomycin 6-kinase [Actinocatenispora rupis]
MDAPDLPIHRWLGRTDAERRWLAGLPRLVAELADRWQVRTGPPFTTGTSSWAAPGVTPDGQRVVLKVAWPHREARYESAALRVWDGAGAVRVLRADEPRYAMLVERCLPGTPLSRADLGWQQRLAAAATVLRRLWSVPVPADAPFEHVGTVTAEWAGLVRQRMRRHRPPFDPGLVELGAELLESLPRTATRTVLVHGDANPDNLLAAHRSPWLAIDAKPMLGDPAYDAHPLLAQLAPAPADSPATLAGRYRMFAELVGEPAERLLCWALARTVEGALWSVSRDDRPAARDAMARAAALARATS